MQIDSAYAKYPQTAEELVNEANDLFENHGEYRRAYVVHGGDPIIFDTFTSSSTQARKVEGEESAPDSYHNSPMMCLYLLWEVLLAMKRDGKTKIYWRSLPKVEKSAHPDHPYYGVMRVAFR